MNNEVKQSSFIKIFAWISIIFSGFAVFVGILQNIMMQTVMKNGGFSEEMKDNIPDDMPPMMVMIFENFELMIMGTLLLSVITLIASITLLKRKNWARLFFIVLFVLGILWTVIGGYMQLGMMDSMMFQGEELSSEVQSIQSTMKIFMAVMMVAMLALYIYLIKRLSSTEIKREFLVFSFLLIKKI